MERELTHHGIKGMKWGVRRFQNADGSLTAAGRKRYATPDEKAKKKIASINSRTKEKIKKLKAQSKADAKVAKAKAKADAKIAKAKEAAEAKVAKAAGQQKAKPQDDATQTPKQAPVSNKPKSVKEMSDDELRAKINRIRLEKELKSLEPEQVSAGQKFVSSLKNDVIAPAAREAGKKALGHLTDYANKKLADSLGLNKKDFDSVLNELKKEVDFKQTKRKKIQLDEWFAERDAKNKAADKNDNSDSKTDDKAKTSKKEKAPKVEIVGEGTSKYKADPFSRFDKDVVVDVPFKDVEDSSATSAGRDFVSQYLLLEG